MKDNKKHGNEERKVPFPDMRIDCYGKGTTLYLDGKELGGITELKFEREGKEVKK